MSPRRDVLLAEQTQLYQLSGYVLVVLLLLLSRDKDGDWVVWSRVAGEGRAIQESIRHRLATTWTLTLRDPCCRRSFDDLAPDVGQGEYSGATEMEYQRTAMARLEK